MPKFKVHGSMYEPSSDGANADGYLNFWDVVEADDEQEAIEIAKEDYGDYNHVTIHGTVKSETDETKWLARNPD